MQYTAQAGTAVSFQGSSTCASPVDRCPHQGHGIVTRTTPPPVPPPLNLFRVSIVGPAQSPVSAADVEKREPHRRPSTQGALHHCQVGSETGPPLAGELSLVDISTARNRERE